MYHGFWLLATSLVIVVAAVALVVGVKRLNRRLGLDGCFVGEAMLALAWVLPEVLITSYALILPSLVPTHPGNSYIEVGATMASAAATVFLVGLINVIRPGSGGLEVNGLGGPLASAAMLLMMACISFVGLVVGAGTGVDLRQILAGTGVTVVYLLTLRIVTKYGPKAMEPEPLFQLGGGTAIQAVALTCFAIVALVYATPIFDEELDRNFRLVNQAFPVRARSTLGAGVMALGILLAIPDLILALMDLRTKAGGAGLPRMFLTVAALWAFTAVAGLDPDTLFNAIATDLAGTLALLIFFIGVVIVFFLATALPRSVRLRGLIVLALALAGLVFSVLVLDVPPRLPSAR